MNTDQINEIFIPIPGWTGYLISNLGRVYSIKSERFMAAVPNSSGYARVHLSNEDGDKFILLHHLMATAFLNYHIGDTNVEIHHIDNDRENNQLSNLMVLPRKTHRHLHHNGSYLKLEC